MKKDLLFTPGSQKIRPAGESGFLMRPQRPMVRHWWSLLLTGSVVLTLLSAGVGNTQQKPNNAIKKSKNTRKKPESPHHFITLDEAVHHKKHGFIQCRQKGGSQAKFEIFVPFDYSYTGGNAVPLILYLHGLGESGQDGVREVSSGPLGPIVENHKKSFPFLVVFPQVQHGHPNAWSAGTPDAQRAMAILAGVEQHYRVDARRMYLTGYSMGGHGTWSLAAANPQKWAAIVPIAGWGPGINLQVPDNSNNDKLDPNLIIKVKDIPCWCFHSKADHGVKLHHSQDLINALQPMSGTSKWHPWAASLIHGPPHRHAYTWFDSLSHGETAKHVYSRYPQLYEWLLSQKKR